MRPVELRLFLPSSLDAIERFCRDFRLWRRAHCRGIEPFSSELILREALTNAVVHGGSDPSKQVLCILRAHQSHLTICVSDGGPGFDWRARWDKVADLCDTGGRGMEIFRRYANRVRFTPSGNGITLLKRFQRVQIQN